jgi:GntR family transcriptional repressor for pyruvate dehydrogenase complex
LLTSINAVIHVRQVGLLSGGMVYNSFGSSSPLGTIVSNTHTPRREFPQVTREPRLSDKVANLLLESITNGDVRPGERLPSERVLGEQFGVSRTVIREAVRALVAKGVIEVRTGSGLRVAAVNASAVTESMTLFLRGQAGMDYGTIHEVRAMIEIQVAGLAAERRTDDDIAAMREICDRMATELDDVTAASSSDVAFHRKLAEATHNELYVIMLDSIGDILLEVRRETLGVPGRIALGVKVHRGILARVEAGDVEGARAEMMAHLSDSERVWREFGYVVGAKAANDR